MKQKSTQNGITLIALVITIIVMLILVAVTITVAVNGGLFDFAGKASKETHNAINAEQQLANGGITIGGTYYNSIDEYLKGNSLTLGAVYTDDMIGQPITYSANGQTSWIVFGKDSSGNILITTELPIDEAFELEGSAEKWLTYEEDLNTACSEYGGTVQEVQVESRSIKMEDINYVAGFTKPTFDTYTFGSTQDYDKKQVNYYYPSLNASDNNYWQNPTSATNTETFDNDWYGYYYDKNSGEYKYQGSDTEGVSIPASDRNLKTNNFKYIWGGDTEDTQYNDYLVASRSAIVDSSIAKFFGTIVGYRVVNPYSSYLCGSDANGGSDRGFIDSFGIRPIVILPPSLKVIEQSNGTYDLAK